eukprot:6901816-Prymnesium_polylepis.1
MDLSNTRANTPTSAPSHAQLHTRVPVTIEASPGFGVGVLGHPPKVSGDRMKCSTIGHDGRNVRPEIIGDVKGAEVVYDPKPPRAFNTDRLECCNEGRVGVGQKDGRLHLEHRVEAFESPDDRCSVFDVEKRKSNDHALPRGPYGHKRAKLVPKLVRVVRRVELDDVCIPTSCPFRHPVLQLHKHAV